MKKVKLKKRWFQVYETIFNRRVHVFLNYTPEEHAKWLTKIGAIELDHERSLDDFSGFSTEMTLKTKPTEWIIYVKNFDWTIRDQGTLIHEIVHTIIKIWATNNIPFNLDTQEFLAHSIGNLYEDIARKIFYPKRK